MGMFDYVNYRAPCLKCGYPLTEKHFQSKDHHCLLQVVAPKKVRNFYSSCPQCRTWNEYKVKVKVKAIVPKPHPEEATYDDESTR